MSAKLSCGDISPIRVWFALQWRHNERDGVSNHQPHDCLLSCLFRRGSKKTSKICVTGLCAGNSPMTGEFPTQRTSNAENVSIWWRHHGMMWRQRSQNQKCPLREPGWLNIFAWIGIGGKEQQCDLTAFTASTRLCRYILNILRLSFHF